MLVGQLLPAEAADWSAEATGGQVLAEELGGGAQRGSMEITRMLIDKIRNLAQPSIIHKVVMPFKILKHNSPSKYES